MFFTQMSQFMTAGVDYNLTLSKNETGMTVLVMPRMNDLKDGAQHHLPPLTLSGTPEELDQHFMAAVAQPVQRAAGLLSSMAQFERQAEKAAANSKAAKELKDKESKEVREKREKYDKYIKRSGEQEAEKEYSAAIDSLRQARLHATEESAKSVDEKIATLRAKTNGGSLFGAPTLEQTPQTNPQYQPQPQVHAQFNAPTPVQPNLQQQTNAPALVQPNQQPQFNAPIPAYPQTAQPNPQLQSPEPLRQPAYADPFEQIPAQGAITGAATGVNPPAVQNMPYGASDAHYPEQTGERQQAYMRDHPVNPAISLDGPACREDEYSAYPDFPRELAAQPMYNPQMF